MTKRDFGIFALCLTVGAAIGVFFKFEVMWDFLNYHYYNGFALMNGRLGYDIAPASVNTYFNPLLDAVTYGLINALNDLPNVYYALTGAVFGCVLFVCYRINALFFDVSTGTGKCAVALSLVLATTGYATFFQIGTSSNEIPVALGVLCGLYLLLTVIFGAPSQMRLVLSAIVLGASAGLKPTAAGYCVASGICLMLFYKRLKCPVRTVFLYGVSGLIGFLATNGFWMIKLFALFGNPFFPFANAVFKSPYFDVVNYSYRLIFADRPFADIVSFPLTAAAHWVPSYWANGGFSDIRWLLAAILLLCYILSFKKRSLTSETAFLALWCGVSFVVWIGCFSVVRYLIPVEMLLPIFLVKGGLAIKPKTSGIVTDGLYFGCVGMLSLACVATVFLSESWGTRRGWNRLFSPLSMTVPAGTVFVTHDAPNSAYLAAIARTTPVRIVLKDTYADTQRLYWNFMTRNAFRNEIDRVVADSVGKTVFWYSYLTKTDIPPSAYVGNVRCRSWVTSRWRNTEDEGHLICVPSTWFDTAFEQAGARIKK